MNSQFFLPMAVGQSKPLGGAETASCQAARRAKEPGATEANGVFGKVVVDLDAAVLEEYEELFPLAEGIGYGLTGEALGQVFAPG